MHPFVTYNSFILESYCLASNCEPSGAKPAMTAEQQKHYSWNQTDIIERKKNVSYSPVKSINQQKNIVPNITKCNSNNINSFMCQRIIEGLWWISTDKSERKKKRTLSL